MKLIHNFKSPNYNERNSKNVELIIIHYTALKSANDSIRYLCSKKTGVSSHYLISINGDIYSLVSEKKRAWHAGHSYWDGKKDINSISIGIELDYFPNKINKKYSKKMIISLTNLLNKLVKKYKILPKNILGHSDIAPYRKIDPGINFPWMLFEDKKIAYKVKKLSKKNKYIGLLEKWFLKYGFFSNKKKILFMLDIIGYDISLAKLDKSHFERIIFNYASRFKPYKNNLLNKNNIIYQIQCHFLNIILTKEKK